MTIPSFGDWFIDGSESVCQMGAHGIYERWLSPHHAVKVFYIETSESFRIKRNATASEITSLTVKGEQTMQDLYFSVILEDDHDTTQGLKTLESQYIEHVYKLAKYNQSRAAKMLGISRGCMRMKLAEYFPGQYL